MCTCPHKPNLRYADWSSEMPGTGEVLSLIQTLMPYIPQTKGSYKAPIVKIKLGNGNQGVI